MRRFTNRDLAIFVFIGLLAVAAAVFALSNLTRWAIVCVGALVGVSAIIVHAQFVVRRATYGQLRRESRATRESTKRTLRVVSLTQGRVDELRADVKSIRADFERVSGEVSTGMGRVEGVLRADARAILGDFERVSSEVSAGIGRVEDQLRAEAKVVRADLDRIAGQISAGTDRFDSARTEILSASEGLSAAASLEWDAQRADFSSSATELAALRAELRGVRVAQQLFSQSVAAIRLTTADSAVQVDRLVEQISGLASHVDALAASQAPVASDSLPNHEKHHLDSDASAVINAPELVARDVD